MSPTPLRAALPRVVVGQRIELRHMAPTDIAAVDALVSASRRELSEFLAWAMTPADEATQREVQARFDDRWAARTEVSWTIVEGGEIRGMLGLHRRGGPDELEIGYWLSTAATGRGLMTEGCTMACDVAFSTEDVDAVEIVHDAANLRSEAVPARLGFRRVGAYTSPAHAPRETGVKVRWRVERAAWCARARPPSVVRVEP